jgi:toxin ParE1/3/4
MKSGIRLQFSEDAQQDIDDIHQYTFDEWGYDQMVRYQSVLYAGFERIRAFPEIGRLRDELTREFRLGSHVVLYRYAAGMVTILRVIHPRQLSR